MSIQCSKPDALPCIFVITSPSLILSKYHSIIFDILHEHAPVRIRSVPFTYTSPWYTPEPCILKATGRCLDSLFRKTSLTVHYLAFLEHHKNYKSALKSAPSDFVSGMINKSSNKPKALFNNTQTHQTSIL